MDSIPQLYICGLRTEVSEARELVSCLLAAWLQSIPKTGSCQLSSSQVLRKKHLNILEVGMSQMVRTEVGWSSLQIPAVRALRTLTPHLLLRTEALLLCHMSQLSQSLTSSPPGGGGPPQGQAAQLPCSL